MLGGIQSVLWWPECKANAMQSSTATTKLACGRLLTDGPQVWQREGALEDLQDVAPGALGAWGEHGVRWSTYLVGLYQVVHSSLNTPWKISRMQPLGVGGVGGAWDINE